MLQTNVLGHPILQRVLSIYITRPLLSTSVTATQVTVAMLLCSVMSSVMIALGWVWLGFVLMYVSILLDAVDGEVARYRKISSLRSIYLDLVNHLVTQAFFFLAVAFWVSQGVSGPLSLTVLMIGAFGALTFPIRRANGDLHRVIFVRPYADPGLYMLDAPALPTIEAPKGAEKQLSMVAKAVGATRKFVYDLHGYVFMLIVFALLLLGEDIFFGGVGHPLLSWAVIVYTITCSLYMIREIIGGHFSVDNRVRLVERRLEMAREKKAHSRG